MGGSCLLVVASARVTQAFFDEVGVLFLSELNRMQWVKVQLVQLTSSIALSTSGRPRLRKFFNRGCLEATTVAVIADAIRGEPAAYWVLLQSRAFEATTLALLRLFVTQLLHP